MDRACKVEMYRCSNKVVQEVGYSGFEERHDMPKKY